MSERKASMGDKIYRGDVVKFIRNNISLGTFMKRTVKTADEACWDLCDKLNYIPAIEEKPEPHEIGYDDCANALLKMWMDNVLTDGEYYRIANKLNEKWGKTELPEPYKGVTDGDD